MSDLPLLRYGVLGAANIARLFTQGLRGSAVASVDAVASRGAEKAAAFAAEMGIPRHHASYEALLADPAIDAIYIPLPNHLHAEWAIKACNAGKHVLCEKPLAMNVAEARAMFDAARANGVHLVEAYPYMSQPQTLRVREILASGLLGKIQLVSAAFGFALVSPDGAAFGDPANIRLDPTKGGGGLLDAGTYAMSMLRIAAGERPTRVLATGTQTQSGVDQTVVAIVEFPSGVIGQLSSSLSTAGHRYATIIGEKGVVETSYSNHAPESGGLSLRIKAAVPGTAPFEVEAVPGGDGFRAEGESFARMIRMGAAQWNGASEAESIDVVLALSAIAESARSKAWVNVG